MDFATVKNCKITGKLSITQGGNNMICVCLRDGLGNQLFTYAYARSIQMVNNEKHLYFDTKEFQNDIRSYALDHFKLNSSVKKFSSVEQFIYRTLARVKMGTNPPANPTDEEFKKLAEKGIYFNFNPYAVCPAHMSRSKVKMVRGYYQSYKNFQNIEKTIREELTVVTPPSTENIAMIEQISNENSVCVHVRRGDYTNNPRWSKELNICDINYYKKAMDAIAKQVQNPVFYIFSNCHEDIEWIKENYKFDGDVKYIDLNNPDYEELRLMYSCKHFIISNSTFSWWAQFLSKNKDKVVVAPNIWNRVIDASNIYMESWNLIDVE